MHKNKKAHFEFQHKHSSSEENIKNPPTGSAIIIEGLIRDTSEAKEILPGLLISKKSNPPNSKFIFIIMKEDAIKYWIRDVTPRINLSSK